MTRADILTAAIQAFSLTSKRAQTERVGRLMGRTRSYVFLASQGKRPLTDASLERLAGGLRDHIIRCERIADMIDKELTENPRAPRHTGLQRDARGRVTGPYVGAAEWGKA